MPALRNPRAPQKRAGALGYKGDAKPTIRDEAASGFRGNMNLEPTFKKRRWGTRC